MKINEKNKLSVKFLEKKDLIKTSTQDKSTYVCVGWQIVPDPIVW